MSQCTQAQTLLTRLTMLKEQLLQELRIPTSPTASLGTSANSDFAKASSDRREWREKRENWYSQLKATSYQLKANIEQLESILYISEAEAEQILGEKELFLGSETVRALFDIKLEKKDIPPIPFAQQELEQAASLGLVLMLVINQDKDGKSLTAKRIGEVTTDKLKQANPGFARLFSDPNRYQNEPWYTDYHPHQRAQWILISKDILPDSFNKNFLQQTEIIVHYLQTSILPNIKNEKIRTRYQAALEELEMQLPKLKSNSAILDYDIWQETKLSEGEVIAQKLASLQINQLNRPHLQTIIYLITMYLYWYKKYLFSDINTWSDDIMATSNLYSGLFVELGMFESSGMSFGGWSPARGGHNLGVSFMYSH